MCAMISMEERLINTNCYVMLCYVMLCYVMLCYVMLCYRILRTPINISKPIAVFIHFVKFWICRLLTPAVWLIYIGIGTDVIKAL